MLIQNINFKLIPHNYQQGIPNIQSINFYP